MRELARPASTRVRCPKCGSRSLVLTETGWWSSEFRVVDGRLDRAEGIHQPGGMDRVDAECSRCNHRWRVRKALQITDCTIEDDTNAN